MAAQLVLEQPQGDCLLCGIRPKSEDEHQRTLPMVHAVGLDVNWGQNVDICFVCAGVIADLLGRVEPNRYNKLHDKYELLLKEHEEMSEAFERQKERLRKIIEGARARKEQVA